MDQPAPPSQRQPATPAADGAARPCVEEKPAHGNGSVPLDGHDTPPPFMPVPTHANGNGHGSKRGVTAAEALAAELHREIARREDLERRLSETEERLAAALAAPSVPVPPAPPVEAVAHPAPPSPELLARLAAAESQLAVSEERLSYLLNTSRLGFFDDNLQTGSTYYSPGFREMLGYQPAALPDSRQTFLDLLHPDDHHNEWLSERQPVGEGVTRFTRHFRLRHQNGTYCWIESTGVEFCDAQGHRVRAFGFHRDITERKQLEERLHQSEERFNLLVTSSPLGFFDTDLTTGRTYYSPLWKEMLGYRPEELADTHQTWLDLLHPDDRPGIVAISTQRVFGESFRSFSHTSRLRQKNGDYRWVQASGINFYAPDGRLLRALGFHADIHALKMAEEALEHEKEFLGVTLDSISDGVITTDAEGHVTYLNAAAETLCGLPLDDAAGLPIEEFYRRAGAQSRRQADNPVRAVLASGMRAAPHDPAHLVPSDRPPRVISDNAAPIVDPAGHMGGAVLVFHDITDRHRAAEELQKAGRIESLGVLAGGIAHDFNNLLTAILGNLSVARTDNALPARTAEALGRAEKSCWRARDLTGQLLTFAQGGDPVRKTLGLAPIIERAARGATANTSTQLSFHFEDDLPTVEADENQIVQVLHNMSLNAVQAMPGGGSLQISVGLVVSPEGLAAVEDASTPAGAYIEVILRDNGTGIAPEHLPKIFDPFFSTRSNGTGLGLAIAYSVVRKHDGVIRVESHVGAGTTFTIYLPVSPQAALPPSRPAEPPAQSGERVLFMDDDPDIRDLAGAILKLMGYEPTLTVEGGETLAAYQSARASGQPYAAVILDLTIPGGMGGRETIRRLREIDPDVRAIVSSGYSNDAVIADFRAHGFVAMVAKPYRMEDLAKALNEAILGAPVGG